MLPKPTEDSPAPEQINAAEPSPLLDGSEAWRFCAAGLVCSIDFCAIIFGNLSYLSLGQHLAVGVVYRVKDIATADAVRTSDTDGFGKEVALYRHLCEIAVFETGGKPIESAHFVFHAGDRVGDVETEPTVGSVWCS